jgi:hypothetical protein
MEWRYGSQQTGRRQRAQGRGQKTFAAQDDDGRCIGMDQAQQGVRRVHGVEKASQKERTAKRFKGVRIEKKRAAKKKTTKKKR